MKWLLKKLIEPYLDLDDLKSPRFEELMNEAVEWWKELDEW